MVKYELQQENTDFRLVSNKACWVKIKKLLKNSASILKAQEQRGRTKRLISLHVKMDKANDTSQHTNILALTWMQ